MPLSAENLQEKYYDIANSYQEIINTYKSNILSIGQVMKDKYVDFQNKYPKLFRKIVANQITNDFLKNIMTVADNTITDKKRDIFQKANPDLYKEVIENGVLDILNQIKKIRTNITEYIAGYKKDFQNSKEEKKSYFIKKYRNLLTNNRYKGLFKGWINETMPHDVTLKLLSSYSKMQRNELSEQDAATSYSQHIVDEYIKPGLSK
jgi:hypothetical protein